MLLNVKRSFALLIIYLLFRYIGTAWTGKKWYPLSEKGGILDITCAYHSLTSFDWVNHTDEESSWDIESQDDVLTAWRKYLEKCSDKHKYCLEKYHIIECGYSIKCNPNIPEELYEQIGAPEECIIESPFISCSAYSTKVLEDMKTKNWLEIEAVVIGSKSLKEKFVTEHVDFVEQYFRFCLSLFKKKDLYKRSNRSESNFSRLFDWPAVDMSIESNDTLEFLCGEYPLKSSEENYNTDGCVIDENDYELFLLETSGKLQLNEKWKYGYDHVKCTIGALSIFNALYKKFFFASKDTAMKLQIPYLHAMDDSLHLWVLELCSEKLYISNKVCKCKVPENINGTTNVLMLGNLLWCLKSMKQEHGNYQLQSGDSSRVSLVKMVSSQLQRPVKGEGFGILLPEEKDEDNCTMKFTSAKVTSGI